MWDELGKRDPKGTENSLRDCDRNLDVLEIWPRTVTVQTENHSSEQVLGDGQFQNMLSIMINNFKILQYYI